ncbi:hypothetical protein [Parashewanella tropica]|uniref:hypothetical protein n=1 Tax=Parashewanella tropica TaxID=2547970 RepID=UPI00105A903D|nr:hypothetical protein [Parashewanella tropica]
MFKLERKKNRVIKLYVLNVCSEERVKNLQAVSDLVRGLFNQSANQFDIGGPYRISKGKTVGEKSFWNKLNKFGHDKYSYVTGERVNEFGFELSYIAPEDCSEIIVWYDPALYSINVIDILKSLIIDLDIRYGYAVDLRKNYDIRLETRIRKGVFSTSVTVDAENIEWNKNVPKIKDGIIRRVYPLNILNPSQYHSFPSVSIKSIHEKIKDLVIIESKEFA